jgi:glycosyltransferase involved in cell wall biosynthesis
MKIGINFHSTDSFISGVEYYTLGLLNGLLCVDKENDYIVFTNQPRLIRKYVIFQKNLSVIDLSHLKTRVQRIFWEHFHLPKLIRKKRVSVLHCPHYICPVLNCSIPYVVTVHDTIAVNHPEWCKRSNAVYYRMLMGPTIRKARKIIVPSQITARKVVLNFQLETSNVRVIHPGIDKIFNRETDLRGQNRIRKKLNLPEKYVLFVGNFEPKKNIKNLLLAYEQLKQKLPNYKLVLVGKRRWKSQRTLLYLRKHFTEEDIVLPGYVAREELPFVYQMADVFVWVSHCEGFGFPPLEAMACGTAVAASNVGILSEINSKAFCLVDSQEPQSIAKLIYSLIADTKLRQSQIEIEKIEIQRFDWESAAKKTLAVYREANEVHE